MNCMVFTGANGANRDVFAVRFRTLCCLVFKRELLVSESETGDYIPLCGPFD
jgi:hypothetical protein